MKFYKKVSIPITAREFGFFKRNKVGLDEIAKMFSEGIEKSIDELENGMLESQTIKKCIQTVWENNLKSTFENEGRDAGVTSLVVKRKIIECFAVFISIYIQKNNIPD